MEVDASIYHSPKRKRGQPSRGPSLVTSGLSQTLPSTTTDHDEIGSYSPSTKVTRKFQKLDLRSPIDLPSSFIDYSPVQEIRETPTLSPTDEQRRPLSPLRDFKPPESERFTFESPISRTDPENATPTPVTKPLSTPRRGRMKSPPPSLSPSTSSSSSSTQNQWWTASEITGWSPDDPDEDNYGLNGVGYAKPAAKAWDISQKRKQQIAEYRSRETREARERRHQKRLSGFGSGSGSRAGSRMGSPLGTMSASVEGLGIRKIERIVHFDDG